MKKLQEVIKANAPCYIYDNNVVVTQCNKLTEALSGFSFLYSIKTNPYPSVVKSVAKQGFGADAASAQEVEISLDNGIKPQDIYYSAPGRTKEEIEQCIEKSVIIADSFSEIEMINDVAKNQGKTIKIGLRINPNFTMDNDDPVSSKFGIDIELLDELDQLLLNCKHIVVSGIHIHLKSQETDFKKIGLYYEKCFAVAQQVNDLPQVAIEFINFGSGIGALYDKVKDAPVDLKELSNMTKEIVARNKETLKAKLIIESGRFVICNAGTYYTEIVDIKKSRGVTYYIVKNAMNGFLRPAIANLIKKVSGNEDIGGYEPLFTSNHAFGVSVLNDTVEKERVTIAGNLCTSLDVIDSDILVNRAQVGDIVAVTNAGSYAYSLSPLLFSSHPIPKQIYMYDDKFVID